MWADTFTAPQGICQKLLPGDPQEKVEYLVDLQQPGGYHRSGIAVGHEAVGSLDDQLRY